MPSVRPASTREFALFRPILVALRTTIFTTVFVSCATVFGIWSSTARAESAGESDAAAVDYLHDIKPVLKERCFACHGALKQESDLRVDTGEAIRLGGDSGVGVVAGEPEASLLIERVIDPDPSSRMPPEGEPLTAAQIEILKEWVAQGAESPADEEPEADPSSHWAFQPIVRPQVPPRSDQAWGRNPIDAFIAARHESLGLTPQSPADSALQVRRLHMDLVGMPPTPAEAVAILGRSGNGTLDESDYAKLVESLLEDPRHGERWARHWMDIWRYSDWFGLGDQLRNSQLHIWHWRDWIVESLNEDLPYDEMVRLMLAGDELAPRDLQKLRATGYLARNFFLFNRHQWMDETVEHVSKSFLGLTMNCSKCHDHKYDPLSHDDYYRMRAFFEPYHVRLDMLPGQVDLNRDAIPRAFDGPADVPTYLFIRGEETRPDKSREIPPGVPDIVKFKELEINPIDLPAEAWQTERRPWVQDAHLAAADAAVQVARNAVSAAGEALAQSVKLHEELLAKAALANTDEAPNDSARSDTAANRIVDDFSTLDPQRWELVGGDWHHQPGLLQQRQDGATRAAVRWVPRPPRDFDISLRFTTTGGSMWKSVGIAFDVTTDPHAGDAAAGVNEEQFVYVSAVDGGSKVQVAYRRGGVDQYPGDAARAMPIELNRSYTLRVQVRDTLVNVSLDGAPMVAWQTPLARRDGGLHFTTFDALSDFHEISIAPLADDVVMRTPASAALAEPTNPEEAERAADVATAKLRSAESSLAVAQAERESLRRRIAALSLAWQLADTAAPEDDLVTRERQARADAIKAERRVAVAVADRALADAQVRRAQATEDQWEALDKEIETATQNVASAQTTADSDVGPDEKYASISGAQWTPTRFLSSTADDPAVPFPPRSSGRRTALADWITDPRNPLTARVAVNHIWTRHMGTPLVPTVFDFGRQGTPPTHPELLDWLAAELIDSGWSMKHIHRLIVSSETYRMSSSAAGREANDAIDGENVYWWRRDATRLESQAVRDSILALSGKVDLTRGGPSIPISQQADSPRRSLYFFHSNNERNLFLTMFDEATVNECYRRQESIVPQQALALTNSRLVLDAIAPIADRIGEASADDPATGGDPVADEDAFIRLSFATLVGFAPTDDEIAASREALATWRGQADTSPSQARAYLVWTLLNHNDFVTIR
jgi:hypothetical protein